MPPLNQCKKPIIFVTCWKKHLALFVGQSHRYLKSLNALFTLFNLLLEGMLHKFKKKSIDAKGIIAFLFFLIELKTTIIS